MPQQLLTPNSINIIKSMSTYWEEVYTRSIKGITLKNELTDLERLIGAEAILKIVTEYAHKEV